MSTKFLRVPVTAGAAGGGKHGARTEPGQDGAVGAPRVRAQEVRGRAGSRARYERARAKCTAMGAVCLRRRHGVVLGWAHNLMFRYTGVVGLE